MPFPEHIKREAKRRAHYCCVACHKPFVEVHHIIPQSEDGPDTLDNAAPLCAGCHDTYGGNPDKRKQIREMRDFWWEYCSRVPTPAQEAKLGQRLDEIQWELQKSNAGGEQQTRLLHDIKEALTSYHDESLSLVTSASTLGEVAAASGLSMPFDLGVSLNGSCPACGDTGYTIVTTQEGGTTEIRSCARCHGRYTFFRYE